MTAAATAARGRSSSAEDPRPRVSGGAEGRAEGREEVRRDDRRRHTSGRPAFGQRQLLEPLGHELADNAVRVLW